ncbi:MAG: DNA-binding protein WhiA [Oscillospiraceae bacterium]|nr:DNA-binding protein WhiA [Oscillospiraceae bacterium]
MGEKTFSSAVKAELCRDKISRGCCARAEAYGILLFCNTFLSREIRIVTTSEQVAKRLGRLFRRAFQITFDQRPQEILPGGKYVFSITDPDKLKVILDTYGYSEEQLSHHVNYAVLEESCCQIAFFRGAFLAGGSILDPQKRYHLEFTTSHYHVARELQPLMAELDLTAKTTVRGANYVTYFKKSEAIADFLTTIGAPLAAMEIMNTKLEKNVVNKVNRRSNCDMANLDKSVAAAQKQISAIQRLQKSGQWDTLPDNLRETAVLRVENPELALSQLAELGRISKSCLNHRLRKLTELAGESD